MILEQITEQLTETLKSRVLALFGYAAERVILQSPPKLSMGDLATPLALELAKALKRKPREIAEGLVDGLKLPLLVASVSVEGAGYLNFRFDRGAFTAAYLAAVEKVDGVALITADHGNCELMFDDATGQPHTAHTTNPVPLILVDPKKRFGVLRGGGALSNVAPTILAILGIAQPPEMTAHSLLG